MRRASRAGPAARGMERDEMRSAVTLRPQKPTAQSFAEDTRKRFGAHADAILKVYPRPPTRRRSSRPPRSAATCSSVTPRGSGSRRTEPRAACGISLLVRSQDPRTARNTVMGVPATSADIGARHAGEIRVRVRLPRHLAPKVPWEAADRTLADAMTTYWSNFAGRAIQRPGASEVAALQCRRPARAPPGRDDQGYGGC